MNALNQLLDTKYDTLLVEAEASLLRVQLNRPEALNALSPQVVHELAEVVRIVHAHIGRDDNGEVDWSVRGIMITATGTRAFAAGADITAMRDMSEQHIRDYVTEMNTLTHMLESTPVPVVAAVNGVAFGGGLELALACDYIYASENAQFALPEVSLGLIPGFGGTVRLPRCVGVDVARELILTGRRIDTEEALRIGLISRVLPDAASLHDAAIESLSLAAAHSATAVATAKRTLRTIHGSSTERDLEVEQDAFVSVFATPDAAEGVSAFVEKRAPQFTGKLQG